VSPKNEMINNYDHVIERILSQENICEDETFLNACLHLTAAVRFRRSVSWRRVEDAETVLARLDFEKRHDLCR
jgi:hypothetical protein